MKQLDFIEEFAMYDSVITGQKTCAWSALHLLKVVDSNAVVAGGAPRDWLLGLQAKDLDIYVQGLKNESNYDFAQRIQIALESEIEDVTSTNDYVLNLDNGVIGVFNVKGCYMPIQVIRCDRQAVSMLSTFHCSLSRAYACRTGLDNNLLVTGNWEFELGQKYKMNMVIKNFDPKYIDKISTRFPEYTLVYEQ
jgi:hypothetical protein